MSRPPGGGGGLTALAMAWTGPGSHSLNPETFL